VTRFVIDGVGIGCALVLADLFTFAVVGVVHLHDGVLLDLAHAAGVVVYELLGEAADGGGVAGVVVGACSGAYLTQAVAGGRVGLGLGAGCAVAS